MSNNELNSHEYEQMMSPRGNKSTKPSRFNYGILAVSVLVLCGISFWSGTAYQKSKQSKVIPNIGNNSGSQTLGMGNGPGGGQAGLRNGQRPNIGEVTAVSNDSVTIQDSRSNSTQTFKITSNTTIQNNGATTPLSDIKVGDTVLVIADSSDTSTASQITLNPNFNGPQPGGISQ